MEIKVSLPGCLTCHSDLFFWGGSPSLRVHTYVYEGVYI